MQTLTDLHYDWTEKFTGVSGLRPDHPENGLPNTQPWRDGSLIRFSLTNLDDDEPDLASGTGSLLADARESAAVPVARSSDATGGLAFVSDSGPRKSKSAKAMPAKTRVFRIKVPNDCPSIDAYHRFAEVVIFGHEIDRSAMNAQWKSSTGFKIEDLRGKQVEISVDESLLGQFRDPAEDHEHARHQGEFDKLGSGQKSAIGQEADRRFREQTGDQKGEKETDGDADVRKRALDSVMHDRELLQLLPQEIKDLMFGGGSEAKPEDYKELLRIANKLKTLSADDLALYKQLPLRPTESLKAFEDAIDLFIAHNDEIRNNGAGQTRSATDPSMQDTVNQAWKGFDKVDVAHLTDDQRYMLAEQKANDISDAQLKYMAEHPGSTLKDFAKSATLMNAADTLDAVGKDLSEAANGDANGWARFAAGSGAGAKLSGLALAALGILYVASWATGVGELATISAAAGYMLASTMTLTMVERDLRLKAASQAKTPEEFEHNVNDMAMAQTTIAVTAAAMVTAAVLHFSAKALFPEAIENLNKSIKNIRDMIRGKSPLAEIKATAIRELTARKAELLKSSEAATRQAAATAKEIASLSPEKFVEWMDKNHSFLDGTGVPPGQKGGLTGLLKSEVGRKALGEYQQRVSKMLTTDMPQRMDQLARMHMDSADAFLAEIDKATTPEQLEAAAEKFEQAVSKEKANDLLRAEQDKQAKKLLEEAQAEMRKEIARQQMVNGPTDAAGKLDVDGWVRQLKGAGIRGDLDAIATRAKGTGHDATAARAELRAAARAASRGQSVEMLTPPSGVGAPQGVKTAEATLHGTDGEGRMEVKAATEPPAKSTVQGQTDKAYAQIKASGKPGEINLDWTEVDLATSRDFAGGRDDVERFLNGKMTNDRLSLVRRFEIVWKDAAGKTKVTVRLRGSDGKVSPVSTTDL